MFVEYVVITSHGPAETRTENFVKFGPVVFEQTEDRHTDRQTRSSQYFAHLPVSK